VTRKKYHRSLRRRYGHGWASESAITRPAGDGLLDVLLVNTHGVVIRSLARKVTRDQANRIIRWRHG
jgi:hypothetical protein